MATLAILAAGLAAGTLHVLSGPDHLAAVLPLAVADRRRAARVGLCWGLGHALGVVVLGALGQLFAGAIDVELLSAWSERLVGVLLVGLGLWALHRGRLLIVHAHAHEHDDGPHEHPHVHLADPSVDAPEHPRIGEHAAHRHSAFGFGLVHGTAGAGHLFGVLPSLVLGPVEATLYLAAYAVSAVGSMLAFSAGAAALLGRPRLAPRALGLSGALSVLVGVGWLATG